MSIRQGTKLIAGTSKFRPDLFDWKWTDHILNDPQWLRTDTFSWQDGGVYEVAYDHLAVDITGKTLQSETVAGTTVQFYLADDGHKVCPASEESNVLAIYNATGVAWYYIIDTTNQRFKLPRSQWGVVGLRDTVGNYVAPGLPNITGTVKTANENDTGNTGAFYSSNADMGATGTGSGTYGRKVHFDASRSSSIYGNSPTVQPPATQMYLYFYVGNFTQTALENTAGLNVELFNDKVDKGHQVVAFQTPTAANNYTWYRKYADGWVEQGGHDTTTRTTSAALSADAIVTFPVEFSDTSYTFTATVNGTYCGIQEKAGYTRTTTNLKVDILATYPNNTYTSKGFDWFACGTAA